MPLMDMNVHHHRGVKDGDFRSEVAIHTSVDRGNVKVDELNRLLVITLQKLN
jgi:hypothetical protein